MVLTLQLSSRDHIQQAVGDIRFLNVALVS